MVLFKNKKKLKILKIFYGKWNKKWKSIKIKNKLKTNKLRKWLVNNILKVF